MKNTIKNAFFCLTIFSMFIFTFANCNQPGAENVTNNINPGVSAWHTVGNSGEPAFLNGWENYGTYYSMSNVQTLQFGIDGAGFLHIIGDIADTTPTTTLEYIFLLPSGFRPASAQYVSISGWNATNGNVVLTMSIMPNGNVAVGVSGTGISGATAAFIGNVTVKL